MAIKRYIAYKDTTITNAFKSNLTNRGTGSNMGLSDVVEVFSIYGQADSGSTELSRALFDFRVTASTDSIYADRNSGVIPASGSVDFFLRLYNAKHAFTLPRNFTLVVAPVSRSWSEGPGLDMEEYSDLECANWISGSSGSAWTNYGGDFHTGAYSAGNTLPMVSASFEKGSEDLEINITSLVEEWLANMNPLTQTSAREQHGIGIYLTSSQEAFFSSSTGLDDTSTFEIHNLSGSRTSYYTKKFFARGTEFFYKRPAIEARWDSSRKDNAKNFYLSSSLVSATDNLNTLYLYNFVRGQLKDIPNLGADNSVLLSVYSSSLGTGDKITLPVGGGVATNDDFNVTGGVVDTGIYSASFAYTSSWTSIYPVWHSGAANAIEFHSASTITVNSFASSDFNPNPKYITKITNLKPKYDNDEVARFRLYIRQKDWSPTIYTKASTAIENEIVEDAYFKIVRLVDELEVIPYGTGSLNHTRMSYDTSGSYFDLDMELLEAEYAYGIKFAYYVNGAYHEQSEMFKFRVE